MLQMLKYTCFVWGGGSKNVFRPHLREGLGVDCAPHWK